MTGRAARSVTVLLGAAALQAAHVAEAATTGDKWYPYNNETWAGYVGSSSNQICQDGMLQSPIDFAACSTASARTAIGITWASQTVELVNNGHAVVLNAKGPAPGKMTVGGKTYTLVQCHFHWGAEHTVSGKQYPFEAHCVHTKDGDAGNYGVFGVFFEIGAENAWLKNFEDQLPAKAARRLSSEPSAGAGFDLFGHPMDATERRLAAGTTTSAYTGPLDYKGLFGNDARDKFWDYRGSFTTPPCTEAVDFYIMQTKQTMTQAQLDKFKTAIGWGAADGATGNFRPAQPLNGRIVSGCDNADWYPYKSEVWAKQVDTNSNEICQDGMQQSPIDFPGCAEARARDPIEITWASQKVELVNNGHAVVLNAKAPAAADGSSTTGQMKVEGKTYNLVQCHFHWGSEHTVGMMQYPFEAHCVHSHSDHTANKPHYGVFGVFYKIGAENTFLKNFEDQLTFTRRLSSEPSAAAGFDLFGNPMDNTTKRRLAGGTTKSTYEGPLDYKGLYGTDARTKFWNYHGSFTTPPCTEAVDFYIMMEPQTMTQAQLEKFKTAIGWASNTPGVAPGGNYRPPQPLNNRLISGCAVAVWYPYKNQIWASQVGSNSNQICQHGSLQSPIDFAACAEARARDPIAIDWASQNVELINNGHAVQLTAKGATPGKMTVEGNSYTLAQCHFHYGSEHTVSGKQYPFEAHCVHLKDGAAGPHYGVFGVFFEIGAENAFLKRFEDQLTFTRRLSSEPSAAAGFDLFGNPMDATKRKLAGGAGTSAYTGPLDFKELYGTDARTKFWNYHGSFTTPPCTEAVDFYISQTPQTMTQAQLDKFKVAIGWGYAPPFGNFRPPQPLNGRVVSGCAIAAWYPYTSNAWAKHVGVGANQLCQDGMLQSPIDFQNCGAAVERDAIGITWATQKVELINNGHAVQLNAKGEAPGKMTVDGKTYTLAQCHFHYGSEHTVSGKQYPFEAHCVHTKDGDAGNYGVFGIFFRLGDIENPFLKQFEDQLTFTRRLSSEPSAAAGFDLFGNPMDNTTKRRLAGGTTKSTYDGGADGLDFKGLYGKNTRTKFWNYRGSFTTPPCTEAVDFYIMMQPQSLTQAQLDKFKTAIGWMPAGGNFRPPQPINGRMVGGSGCKWTAPASSQTFETSGASCTRAAGASIAMAAFAASGFGA